MQLADTVSRCWRALEAEVGNKLTNGFAFKLWTKLIAQSIFSLWKLHVSNYYVARKFINVRVRAYLLEQLVFFKKLCEF